MSEIKVNSIKGVGASAAAITVNNTDGTCTANITNNLSNRNLVINGAMQVAQRATSVTGITSGNYYVCDRWILGYGTAGTWTLSQSTDTPNDFGNSFKFDCTTANGSLSAGSNLQLKQFFEGQNLQQIQKGTSTAKEVTVSFYVKTNKTGTYVVELMDHDNSNRHCNKSYTVSDTNWNRYELTFPADTTGTLNNDNAKSFEVGFWLVAGSTFTGGSLQTTWSTLNQGSRAVGQINLADNTSNEWFITGVQLEVSDHATDFEHRSFGQELDLCRRYCQVYKSVGNYTRFATTISQSTSSIRSIFYLKKQLRAAPTYSYSGNFQCPAATNFNMANMALESSSTSTDIVVIKQSGMSVNANNAFFLAGNDDTSASITFNSEL